MIAPLETLTVEIDSDVLAQAEKVCTDIGITLQDAVNMFLRETVIQQRWPMDTMDSELPETLRVLYSEVYREDGGWTVCTTSGPGTEIDLHASSFEVRDTRENRW